MADLRATKSARTRARIAEAALGLFVEQGIDGTTTRDIAQAADVAEGARYRHWAGKDELAWELFRDSYAAMAAELREVIGAAGGGASAAAVLPEIVGYLCASFDAEPDRFRYLLLTQHDFVARVVDDMASPIEELDHFLSARMKAGDLPKRDVSIAIALLLGPLLQTATFIIYGRMKGPLARSAASLSAAALAGLLTRPG